MKLSNKLIINGFLLMVLLFIIDYFCCSLVYADTKSRKEIYSSERQGILLNNMITINYTKEKGVASALKIGNNLLGYEGQKAANFGFGVIDGKWGVLVKTPLELAKDLKISAFRYPGGCGTHTFDWKQTIGKGRKAFLFGLDEFMRICAFTKAEPVITISYFTGTEADKADLIEYLNSSSDGTNPNGGVSWAAVRAKNGHPEPYRVRFFEIGNEVYHGDHRNIRNVSPEEYGNRYLIYWEALKTIDPAIKIGAILWSDEWNEKVLTIIQDRVDFGVMHFYPSPVQQKEKLEKMDSKYIYRITMGEVAAKIEREISLAHEKLLRYSGRNIPIAITEFNGGFVQEKPLPYRHALGTALINAHLLAIFMKPESNILMANYWNFINEYWGMIANGFDGTPQTLNRPYYKRPNYYVFEMYSQHFGELLLDAHVISEVYEYKNAEIPYLSVNSSKNKDSNKVYLMVINKNMDESVTSTIELKGFIPSRDGNAWVLNGPSVDATNEVKHDNVKVTHHKFEVKGNPFEFTFEPHSLTAIELTRANAN